MTQRVAVMLLCIYFIYIYVAVFASRKWIESQWSDHFKNIEIASICWDPTYLLQKDKQTIHELQKFDPQRNHWTEMFVKNWGPKRHRFSTASTWLSSQLPGTPRLWVKAALFVKSHVTRCLLRFEKLILGHWLQICNICVFVSHHPNDSKKNNFPRQNTSPHFQLLELERLANSDPAQWNHSMDNFAIDLRPFPTWQDDLLKLQVRPRNNMWYMESLTHRQFVNLTPRRSQSVDSESSS